MPSNLFAVDDTTFDAQVLKSDQLVLVDFWAEWCGPCKALAPVLDEIAAEAGGEFVVTKLNADENKASVERFGVRGLPSVLFFRNGVECDRITGVVSKSRLVSVVEKHLGA